MGKVKNSVGGKGGSIPALVGGSWLTLPKARHVLAQLVCVNSNILLKISPAKIQLQQKIHFLIFCAVLLLSFHCPSKRDFVCVQEDVFFTVANSEELSRKPRGTWRLLFLASLSPGFALFSPWWKCGLGLRLQQGHPLQCKQYKTNYFSHYQQGLGVLDGIRCVQDSSWKLF